jgi:RNA polymerase sigma-70 factor, ECF subfamily
MDREIILLAAARQMDGDAFKEIFELYAPALYKYAYRLCKQADLADELVGMVFESFVQQLSDGRHPGLNLRTNLYEITYGILMRDVRYTNHIWVTNRTIPGQSYRWSAGPGTDDQMLLDALQRALIHDLTEDQRHVVLLRFVEEFSLKETAAITGKKVNNVKVIQNRAIASLRKALDSPVAETHTITLLLRRLAQA